MTKKNSRAGAVALGVLTVMELVLCGGCTPTETGDLRTFAGDLLLNALAALLL